MIEQRVIFPVYFSGIHLPAIHPESVFPFHTPCSHASTAMPMALSVEYCGGQNTGENGASISRSSRLEDTPPEKTVANPG
jgi:hypothetical protein